MKKSVLIALVSAIFLIIAAGGLYYYGSSEKWSDGLVSA